MSKVSNRPAIKVPTVEDDRKITAAGKSDPDAQPLKASQLNAMIPMRSVLGRPKSTNSKLLVSVRYSPEVLDYFKSTGAGWQSKMDGVLKEYVTSKAGRSKSGA